MLVVPTQQQWVTYITPMLQIFLTFPESLTPAGESSLFLGAHICQPPLEDLGRTCILMSIPLLHLKSSFCHMTGSIHRMPELVCGHLGGPSTYHSVVQDLLAASVRGGDSKRKGLETSLLFRT